MNVQHISNEKERTQIKLMSHSKIFDFKTFYSYQDNVGHMQNVQQRKTWKM